ncbi:hypothetical protein [Microbacterium sp. 2FI]|uniref:hypothetical protein n=1 Tax=Microbacterium sp. 2FI TaxID=2502193 RepID=UPI0010F73627|nr:hypothetical protein [Microbacterium sp. 2FI]
MTLDTTKEAGMFDRSDAEAVIFHAAIVAFTYYPDKHLDEPGYTLDEDLEWCAGTMTDLPAGTRQELVDEIRMLAAEPTRDRQGFIKKVLSLVHD